MKTNRRNFLAGLLATPFAFLARKFSFGQRPNISYSCKYKELGVESGASFETKLAYDPWFYALQADHLNQTAPQFNVMAQWMEEQPEEIKQYFVKIYPSRLHEADINVPWHGQW